MSSTNILENNSVNINDKKSNLIKQFSRNFYKSFQSLKIACINNINENGSPIKKKKKKQQIESTKNTENKSLLNCLNELYFLSSTPQQRQYQYSKHKNTINETKNTSYMRIINSSKKDISKTKILLIPNKSEKNLEVHSLKSINNEYKKNFENKNKLSDKPKSHGKNILTVKKKSFVQIELDPFLERLERFKTKKQQHINNLKSKLSEKENTEILKRPKILKNSLIILEKKYDRNKLYQPYQINEKNIDKNFREFYTTTLKENVSCSLLGKTINYTIDKFNEFYNGKIKWKRDIDQKIKNHKLKEEEKVENVLKKITFKPKLNKRSLNLVNNNKNNIKENSTFNNVLNNKFIHKDKIEKDSMNKYKTKLKNIINNFNDKNSNYSVNKKRKTLKRANTQINICNKINQLKKENEKKRKIINKINGIEDKKQMKQEKKNSINDKYSAINKYTYIIHKKEKIKKKKPQKKKENDNYNFYKINVNSGCAWMNQSYNEIQYDKRYKSLIKNYIL